MTVTDVADIVAFVRDLAPADATALIRELLRARPDAAVEAVDTCKVARAWGKCPDGHGMDRHPLAGGRWVASGGIPHHGGGWWAVTADSVVDARAPSSDESLRVADSALLAGGWVLAGGER